MTEGAAEFPVEEVPDEVPAADWQEQQLEAEPEVTDEDVAPDRPLTTTGSVEADEADLVEQSIDVAGDEDAPTG